MKRLTIISIAVLAVGVGMFITRLDNVSGKTPPGSFVVQYLLSSAGTDETLAPSEYRVRAVSIAGDWKETKYPFNGQPSTWGATGQSLYLIKDNAKQYFGQHNSEMIRTKFRSEDELLNSPQVVRTEEVVGLKTYVLRDANRDNIVESYYAVQTGVTPLKQVIIKDGKTAFVLEALNVEFRELSADEAALPELPVRFDIAEQKLQSLKNSGQSAIADRLQQGINSLKAAK